MKNEINKDKSTFLNILIFIIFFIISLSIGLFFLIQNSGLNIYLAVSKIIVLFLIVFTIYLLCLLLLIIRIEKNNTIPKFLIPIFEKSIRIIYPLMIIFTNIFKIEKDSIRRFFSEINNKIVLSKSKKLNPKDILIVAPHCLQKSSCKYKITGDVNNCKKCGGCDINGLLDLCTSYNVKLYIVTGGTLARKVIKDHRPKGIIAVACERDLSHGILDVKNIPVIGVKNERPNGPCYNTKVDINKVEKAIKHFLRRE
ncbi:DUF116 domain-containing protein [Maledivibacter halophilus]|uniref:DUF116 domain-containing protein n=1 Tax=Maledivibacter halophilus TaxID=36842 RepID=A0A1T5MH72_9FIRM|nr:DUF116 domain-containing protein [Maledivibacter halophilus]SKC87229.1 hypothetical protein SAMN02194393_04672 [Maledivibacter halophilus]